jgi:hypothetical protein
MGKIIKSGRQSMIILKSIGNWDKPFTEDPSIHEGKEAMVLHVNHHFFTRCVHFIDR